MWGSFPLSFCSHKWVHTVNSFLTFAKRKKKIPNKQIQIIWIWYEMNPLKKKKKKSKFWWHLKKKKLVGDSKILKDDIKWENKEMSLLKWVCGHMDMVLILLDHMDIILYTTLSIFVVILICFFLFFFRVPNQPSRLAASLVWSILVPKSKWDFLIRKNM